MLRISLLWFCCFFSCLQQSAAQDRQCSDAARLYQTFREFHYSPVPLDDDFSGRIYRNFFLLLDPGADYITASDMDQFEAYHETLDDLIQDGSCEFTGSVERFYVERLRYFERWLDSMQTAKASFAHEEFLTFEIKPEKVPDMSTLTTLWKKTLKFRYLSSKFAPRAEGEDPTPDQEIWNRVVEEQKCKIEKALNPPGGIAEHISNLFLKAIAQSFDPHSVYLSEEEKQDFDAMLSMEAEGFGVVAAKNMFGEVKIEQLVPGSPAWNSDDLEQGDVIVDVHTDEGEVSLLCMDDEELGQLFSGARHVNLKVTVRKENGKIRSIDLTRARVPVEGNSLRTFLIRGEQTVGYVAVPAFYTSYDDVSGVKGVADDLAHEVMMLRTAGVEGIILDFRSNGGGSMEEAVKVAGMFINEGPVLTIEAATGKRQTVRDFNRGSLYDGPLLIMINGHTASASELVAGCLQDYGRAVVAGSRSYGKSTAQVVIPAFPDEDIEDIRGYVSMTLEAFYRVDGSTHQGEGVVPDVVLPDPLVSLYNKENEYPDALKFSGIDTDLTWQRETLPVEKLRTAAAARVSSDSAWQKVIAFGDNIRGKTLRVSLQESEYQGSFEELVGFLKSIESILQTSNDSLNVEIPQYIQDELPFEELKREDYYKMQESLTRDLILSEAYRILSDQIIILKNGQ